MAKNIVGIDISDFSIEAIALEKSKGSFKLESHSRFRLSPDIVEDGRILNPQKLKDAILKLFQNAKPNPFDQSRKVFISIPESKTFSKVISLPKNIKDKKLHKIAIDKAEESIPESSDNLTAVVKTLSATEDKQQVFYVAAETDILKSFVSIFKELDISIAGITTEAVGSFAGLQKIKDKKNILVLDLGDRTSIVSIFTGEALAASININIGGRNITKALMSKLNISYTQAEEKKQQIGLSPEGDGQTMLISQGQLQPLVDELKIFINYWQKNSQQNIEQVLLIGGLAQMQGIDKYFGDNLNLPTQLGLPFIAVKDLPVGLAISKYINALGLAKIAQQDANINFYKKLTKDIKSESKKESKSPTKEEIKTKPKFSKKTIISLIIALVLLLSAVAIFIFRNQLATLIFKDKVTEDAIVKDIDTSEDAAIEIEEINTDIVVSTNKDSAEENFILGEIYEVNLEKSMTDSELDYLGVLIKMEEEFESEVLAALGDKYIKEGYYIIPYILSRDAVSKGVSEEDFVVGSTLEATINYELLSVSEEKVHDFLLTKYAVLPSDADTVYKILSYTQDAQGSILKLNIAVL
jgi:type IV pilus assembly protein PilM